MKARYLLPSFALAFCALAQSSFGQETFPDNSSNHWAFDALVRLKAEGILVGYPDGLFRGARPASRYEVAVAMNAAYLKIKQLSDEALVSLNEKLKLDSDIQAAIPALKDAVAKATDDIERLKKYGQDIADLKRAADTFELELEQLGVDAEKMKKDMGDLGRRVAKLEAKKPPIDIHGDVDFWFGGSTSSEHSYGLNKDGRLLGTANPAGGDSLTVPVANRSNIFSDSVILHEAAFTISGTNDKGPKWSATIVDSDMFGMTGATPPTQAFGNQSDVINQTGQAVGILGYAPGQEDIYLQEGSITFGGPKANLAVGRIGYSMSPWMFQRIDNTSYYSNDRWDNGKYYFDGALANGKLGPANLTIFGGINSAIQTLQGVVLNPLRSGPIGGFVSPVITDSNGNILNLNVPTGTMTFDRSMGANLDLAVSHNANLKFGYLLLEGDDNNLYAQDNNLQVDASQMANHLNIYGVDGDLNWKGFKFEAGGHKTDIDEDQHIVLGHDNAAWNAKVSYDRPVFGLSAEYRQVDANYVAPGDWGRLGVLRNPSNIKGLKVAGHVRFLKKFKFEASGEFDSGLSNNYTIQTLLGTGTLIRGYDAKLSYDVSRRFSLFAELENTHIQDLVVPTNYPVFGSPDPNYRWTTFGLDFHMSNTSFLNVTYEQSDVTKDYQLAPGNDFHGGFLTSQLTFKF